jgi:hypothetical protein
VLNVSFGGLTEPHVDRENPIAMNLRPKLSFIFIGLVLLLLASGCETTPTSRSTPAATAPLGTASSRAPREPNSLSLERTPNAAGVPVGPVYVVTLFEDGTAIFEGHANVRSQGTFKKTIPREQAAQLFAQVELLNLWNRERRYDVERSESGGDSRIVRTASTEVPWDILRIRMQGRTLRIDGLFFAPHDLLEFKAKIERAVGLAEWIGAP